MSRTPIRSLTATLGAALLLAACSSGDPLADFISEARAVLPASDSAEVADNGLIVAGKSVCAVKQQAQADPAQFGSPEFVAVAVAHCDALAAAPDNTAGAGAATADPPATDAAQPGLSPRGAMPAQIGERIALYGPPMAPEPGQWVTITAIRPVKACAGKGIGPGGESVPAKPENGRFLAVDMTIENGPNYDTAQPGYYAGTAQTYDFVGVDGAALDKVDTTVAFYCTAKEAPFSDLKPGRTYKGTVNIDVPDGQGWLIFGQTSNAGTGYEYQIT
jgi:hypothetical protein